MIPISGRTRMLGLIGWPVEHSASPAMHNAAFAALGLDWCYVPLPVPTEPPERLGEALLGLRALGFRGCNITAPHKQRALPFMDALTPMAHEVGAINTVVISPEGQMLGDNTDAPGLLAFFQSRGVSMTNQRVVIVGSGGAARASAVAALTARCSMLVIRNRSADRAAALALELVSLAGATNLKSGPLDENAQHDIEQADVVIHSTPAGSAAVASADVWYRDIRFRSSQVVFDAVYRPEPTELLAQAEAHGAVALAGYGLLLHQGALSFEAWVGAPAPLDVMRAALEADAGKGRS